MTFLSAREPLEQVVLAEVVHQEADRAAVHAVDRNAAVEMGVHGLEHQPVPAKRNDRVGFVRRRVSVARGQLLLRVLRLLGLAGHERDLFEAGHDDVDTLGPKLKKRAL